MEDKRAQEDQIETTPIDEDATTIATRGGRREVWAQPLPLRPPLRPRLPALSAVGLTLNARPAKVTTSALRSVTSARNSGTSRTVVESS